ncbi:response regulator transcription factor [Streptomyces malaysiensis]|uniref:response regulator transcription factor n=1 Tax=Streptomyces malaysiensis TaxID=92644 RepID=UPI00085350C9|nr:LuxR C-terminal-related transcriptional regulator [Streptomyces sp. SPMA113]
MPPPRASSDSSHRAAVPSCPGSSYSRGGTYALGIGYAGNWLLRFPLLSLASGVVLRGPRRRLGVVIIVLSVSAGVIAGVRGGPSDSLTVSYGTMLSGLVTAAILSLFETVAQLRAARQELARTAVERERLAAVDGATVADIAAKLRLSPATVRNYLSSAIGKTQTRNRMEAVRAARQNGWL